MLLLADGVTPLPGDPTACMRSLGLFILLIVGDGSDRRSGSGRGTCHARRCSLALRLVRLRGHPDVQNHLLLLGAGVGRGGSHPVGLLPQAERRTPHWRQALSIKGNGLRACERPRIILTAGPRGTRYGTEQRFSKIAYAALIALMFGVTTGSLGGL